MSTRAKAKWVTTEGFQDTSRMPTDNLGISYDSGFLLNIGSYDEELTYISAVCMGPHPRFADIEYIYITGYATTNGVAYPRTWISDSTYQQLDKFPAKVNGRGRGIFVAQLGSTNSIVWAKWLDGSAVDESRAICASSDGQYVYVCGYSSSTLYFSATNNQEKPNNSSQGAFIACLQASDGTLLWTRWLNSASGPDVANAMTLDSAGNVIVVGSASGSIDLRNYTVAQKNLFKPKPGGYSGGFIAKFDGNGNLLWGDWIDSQGGDEPCLCVATDSANNIYVGGTSSGTTGFQGTTLILPERPSLRNTAGFLMKILPTGTKVWSRWIDGVNEEDYADRVTGVCVSGASIYVCGSASSSSIRSFDDKNLVGATRFAARTRTSATGKSAGFYACYTDAGALTWSRMLDAPVADTTSEITTSSITILGTQLLIGGNSNGGTTATNGLIAGLTQFTKTGTFTNGFVVTAATDTGLASNVRWIEGTGGDDFVRSVVFNKQGEIYVAGECKSQRLLPINIVRAFANIAGYLIKYGINYFKLVQDFYNTIYLPAIPYMNTSRLDANTIEVLKFIDSTGNPTAAWTSADSGTKMHMPSWVAWAYVDVATVLQASASSVLSNMIPIIPIAVKAKLPTAPASTVPATYIEATSLVKSYSQKYPLWVSGGEGSPNTLAWSNDGKAWTGLGNTIFTSLVYNVATNGQIWVAVGGGKNTIAWSVDGINWNGLGLSIFSLNGHGIAWNGSMWMAAGSGTNTLAWSRDGINWTGLGISVFTSFGWGLAGNGSLWVATGYGKNTLAWSEDDGKTWTGLGTSIFSSYGISAAWNGSRWVATGSGGNALAWSENGKIWNGLGTSIFSELGYGVAWSGTRWIAVGQYTNTIAYSNDGASWTGVGNKAISSYGIGVSCNPLLCVAVGGGTPQAAWSEDNGLTWTGITTPIIYSSYGRGIVATPLSYTGFVLESFKPHISALITSYNAAKSSLPAAQIPAAWNLDSAQYQTLIDATTKTGGTIFIARPGVYQDMIPPLTGATTTIAGNADATKNGQYIVSASGSSQGSPWQAFDNDTSSGNGWTSQILANLSSFDAWIQIQLPAPKTIWGFAFQTTAATHAPETFRLQGSMNGSTWNTIESRAGYSGQNFDVKFVAPTQTPYAYYRLSITSRQNKNLEAKVISIAEVILYEYTGQIVNTKQDQLLSIYNTFKVASDGLQAIAQSAKFKTAYEAARRYIVASELASDTIRIRDKIYSASGAYTVDDLLKARRDVMKTVIQKYVNLNPTLSRTIDWNTISLSTAPTQLPAPYNTIDAADDTTLLSYENDFLLNAAAPIPRWTSFISGIRQYVSNYIETVYKPARDKAFPSKPASDSGNFLTDVTTARDWRFAYLSGDNTDITANDIRYFISPDAADGPRLAAAPYNLTTTKTVSGTTLYMIPSEYSFVVSVFQRYKGLVDALAFQNEFNAVQRYLPASAAPATLTDLINQLVASFDDTYEKWSKRATLTTVKPDANTLAADKVAGTDGVRGKYTALWESLIGEIKTITKNHINQAKALQTWNDTAQGTAVPTVQTAFAPTAATTGLKRA